MEKISLARENFVQDFFNHNRRYRVQNDKRSVALFSISDYSSNSTHRGSLHQHFLLK